jgi:CO/xanthine dehydrogenase Mo-binding subunit/CO/xanthine dehydrogenase FAD-binding subunit
MNEQLTKKQIGRHVRQLDWEARTSGREKYLADALPNNALVGVVLRSPHAHAEILSIDTGDAKSMPGVHAVITSADFPPGVYYPIDFDRSPLAVGVVRYIGEEVAAVAAETKAQAQAAVAAIKVKYRRKSVPYTMKEALAPGAPRMFDNPAGFPPAFLGLPPPPGLSHVPNVRRNLQPVWGDPAKGRAAATVSVSGRFWYPAQAPNCMETHGALAEWKDGRLHMWVATATPLPVRDMLALTLGLDPSMVVVHEIAVGGSFGAKVLINEHEALAAVLARVSKRPVYIILTREEEFETARTRHGMQVELTFGADSGGKLRIIEGHTQVDSGAYMHQGSSVMGASLWGLADTYDIDGLEVDAKLVDTSKAPGGAMRGYGEPQTCLAREVLMDELARKLRLDPIEFRIRNAYRSYMPWLGGKLGSVGLVRCLEGVREMSEWATWKHSRKPGHGIGVAATGAVNGPHVFPGSNRADSAIDLYRDGRVRLRTGLSDTGTGQKTIVAQVVADELGVSLEQVSVQTMDTDETTYDMGAWASRGTHYSAHSVGLTARKFAQRLKSLAAQHLSSSEIRLEGGVARSASGEIPLGELVGVSNEAINGVLTHEESFVDQSIELINSNEGRVGKVSPTHNYAAHVAIVHVDEKTGQLRLKDYFAAHDCGTVMNPITLEGQISGGAAMGIGAALGEELIFWQGKLVNPAFLNYAQPRAADLPNIQALFVPEPDEMGPYGAKGVAETPTSLGAPAVANAVYDAIGVPIRSMPITPDKIINALDAKHGRERRFRIWTRPSRWWIEFVRRAYSLGLFRILHELQMRKITTKPGPAPIKAIETPGSVAEIVRSLGPDAMLIGGGTDVQLRRRSHHSAPSRLVSVAKVDEMKDISILDDGGIVIGAGVTLVSLAEAMREKIPALAETVDEIATPQVRNVATVAGNLSQVKRCWFFRNGFPCYKRMNEATLAPCYAILGDHRFYHNAIDGHRCQAVTPSDLGTVLTALDALVTIAGPSGRREIGMDKFYVGPGETSVKPDEVITRITIPAKSVRRRTTFKKLRLWQGDFALVSAAISVALDEMGKCDIVRICLGAVASVPWRAIATERQMRGKPLSTDILRAYLDAEFMARAHPLEGNAWKLTAVAGIAERAVEALVACAENCGDLTSETVPGNHNR